MIKCIIFDCDGTLVDSELLFNLALSKKLTEHSIEISAEQLVTRFRGNRLSSVLETLASEHDVVFDSTFVEEYRELGALYFRQGLVACDGVVETLPQIKLAMCAASNGPLAKMQLALSVTNLAKYFGENLFSAYQINSWKPEPDLFIYAAEKMGFEANECMVLEDSLVGIQAAEAAGMKAVLYDPHDIHSIAVSRFRIKIFSDLLKLLS